MSPLLHPPFPTPCTLFPTPYTLSGGGWGMRVRQCVAGTRAFATDQRMPVPARVRESTYQLANPPFRWY